MVVLHAGAYQGGGRLHRMAGWLTPEAKGSGAALSTAYANLG